MLNSTPSELEMIESLNLNEYVNKEQCRITLILREMEQGYNNGRVLSIRKQLTKRQEFLKVWQEDVQKFLNQPPQSIDEQCEYFNETEQEIRLKRVQPIYRLLLSKDPKIMELSKRIKQCLDNMGVVSRIPKHLKNSGNIRKYSEKITQGILTEIYEIYQNTIALQTHDSFHQFQQIVRKFLLDYNEQRIHMPPSNNQKNNKQKSQQLQQSDFISIYVTPREEPFAELGGLLMELTQQIDRLMDSSLCDEKDNSVPIYEWQFFDPMRDQYNHPLDNIKNEVECKYNPDIRFPENQNDDQQQQEQVNESEQQQQKQDQSINYLQEFYDLYKKELRQLSPEYWDLIISDMIQLICDSNISNYDLEEKLFNIIKNVEATRYLMINRRSIIKYLYQIKFWQNNDNNKGLNGQSLVKQFINLDKDKQNKIKQNEGKQMENSQISQQEALQIYNPAEYAKMDQQRLQQIFPTSTREDRQEYLRIRLDPLPRLRPQMDKLIKIETLAEWQRKAFEGTQALNVIQSVIYEKALHTSENLLVCAPTGAGKTNIALMTILQELEKRIDKKSMKLINHNFKVVYISPMKALASEIVDKFSHRLKYLGIKVREFTGDMQLSQKELQETHVILTTPEKWDVVTRKTNQIQEQLQLLIIDEIHLLNDDRGAILECVVARTLKQVERAQRSVRLVGLSATLPNYWDVAIFLQVSKDCVFYFDHTYRPVPLLQRFIGVKDPIQKPRSTVRRRKQDIYNEVCYDQLCDVLKHQKQVLIFVHSRKETVNYAKYIQTRATAQNQMHLFQQSKKDLKAMVKIQDRELSKLCPFAIGFHHAGMLRPDRNLMERMFLEGDVRVLVATATLAWGVNLPAYAVIIKGTDIFDMAHAGMQNLSVLDVQQMFGRAGRPQFDNQGEGTLMTDINNVGYYMSLLNNASYIESKLMGFLKEALNAEIVLGNITNYSEAYDWLNHTFFSIRLKRNPLNYSVQRTYGLDLDCDLLVNEKIDQALKNLDELKMIKFDTQNQTVSATQLGCTASHYYIKCETMRILCEQMGINMDAQLNNDTLFAQSKYQYKSMYQLLSIMAQAKEFDVLRVRPEELIELKKIFAHHWVFDERPQLGILRNDYDVPDEDQIIETQQKVIALISGYIAQVHYDNYALLMDTNLVIQNSIRLLRCMLDMAVKEDLAQTVQMLLKLCKIVENRMCEGSTPLSQFSHEIFTGYNSRKKSDHREGYISNAWLDLINSNHSHLTVNELMNKTTEQLCYILESGKIAIQAFRKFCDWLPQIEVKHIIKPISSTILQVQLKVKPKFKYSPRWHLRQEPFWVFVDDEEKIQHQEQFLISQIHIEKEQPVELQFFIPYAGCDKEYRLIVTSDRWLMREEFQDYIKLEGNQLKDDVINYTDLKDQDKLHTSALQSDKFEALYPFAYFNLIQTQVFNSLYNTDDNIIIGSPTGSGKTIMAEFSMMRVFKNSPLKKIVYIAPMKAIAQERLKDWVNRFSKINKNVIELTGDYSPDINQLRNADVLITTPEKWDGVSRSWQNRSYVSQCALIIFDEIHLLGQERGAVLEVIVSRMNLIASKSGQKTRMVGLSTAMANGSDIGVWFGVGKDGFFNFQPSCRPVPITIHFAGFPERAYCPRMATMNKPAYQDIKRYSDGKPVIVFVSSRRQTYLTAMDLIALQIQESGSGAPPYLKCAQWEIESFQDRVSDEYLKQTLGFGIGMHHAGLCADDRTILEELFLSGKIQVLVATSTLAWGVNLPARLVIIKGTEFYDSKKKKFVDMPVTDILQMIGRAGRPQFDTQATACVYVEQSKKDYYRKYINSPFPIESSLLCQLHDHINAEVDSKAINNRLECMEWLKWTYFYKRLLNNPRYYEVKNNNQNVVESYLEDLVEKVLNKLQEFGCVEHDKKLDKIQSTQLGHFASFYYIRHQTINHYYNKIHQNTSIQDLIKILAYSDEFKEVPLRHNEENLNEILGKQCPLKPDHRKYDEPQEKTFLLLQAHMYRLPMPIRDYITDTKLVLDQSVRMLYAMIDLSSQIQGYLNTTINIIKIVQMIVQGVGLGQQCILNVPHFTPTVIEYLKNSNINQLDQLIDSLRKDPNKLKEIVNKNMKQMGENQWRDIENSLNQVPIVQINVNFDQQENGAKQTDQGETLIQCHLNLINGNHTQHVQIQKLSKHKDASWWLCIGIPDQDKILSIQKITIDKSIKKQIKVQLPETHQTQNLYLYLMSDSYIGIDQQTQVQYVQ